jgi:hypothetical protein
VADLDYAAETCQSPLVDLVSPNEFGIVDEVTQETNRASTWPWPCNRDARKSYGREFARLEYGEAKQVKRLLGVPAIQGSIHADEKHTIWHVAPPTSRMTRSQEFGASCRTFLVAEIAVELAEQGITIFLRPSGKLIDESFNLLPSGILEGFDTAEISRVGLHEVWVKLMLPDNLAEVVAEASAIRPRTARRLRWEFREFA